MDRRSANIGAAAALILILAAPSAFCAGPKTLKNRQPAAGGKGTYRLDEVKIVGSVERPEVLFILPRAKFRLLPIREQKDWREEIRRDDKSVVSPE